MGYNETIPLPKETAMSDLPIGKIIVALIFIIVILKTTFVLMWTLIAGVVLYTIRFVKRDTDPSFTQ